MGALLIASGRLPPVPRRPPRGDAARIDHGPMKVCAVVQMETTRSPEVVDFTEPSLSRWEW
jgi:hypothetical protein